MIAEKKAEELENLQGYLRALKLSQAGDTAAIDNYFEWRFEDGLVVYLVELYRAAKDSSEAIEIVKQTCSKRIKELCENIKHQEELYDLLATNLPDNMVQQLNQHDWNIVGSTDEFRLTSSDGLYTTIAELRDEGYVLSYSKYNNVQYDTMAFFKMLRK